MMVTEYKYSWVTFALSESLSVICKAKKEVWENPNIVDTK